MKKSIDGIIGLAVGDALGTPVQFESREEVAAHPVAGMRGFGTFNMPAGTWSDDTSLTLALMDSLIHEPQINYTDIMTRFLNWLVNGEYTPYDYSFDVGRGTRLAIERFKAGTPPLECGGTGERDNGNGSLMRILPMAYYFYRRPAPNEGEIIENISRLTHANIISLIACQIYVNIGIKLLGGAPLEQMLGEAYQIISDYKNKGFKEYDKFYRLTEFGDFANLPENEIYSDGYVVHTLEAALWCLFNTSSYKECMLKAVNLGDDTDSTAAVAGGLAGIYYGFDAIPNEWIKTLVKRDYIENLCDKFDNAIKP